ncbi:MAG: hypothetical protein Q8R10_12320 [Pseudomonas sp.]|uniref:hypothetical protein n=1 Tax=Pseudomonas sp. TaxID=306 RepID=UPI002736E220|nr:hypothetical protein [Pseudomonas sp.]MDP3847196.1 hypothetical protein [Pseudomonas sp.]
MGDYVGGLLNPLLTFISLVLLIKSLALQNEANADLRDEIKITRKTEKLRSFEIQLFNMIDSQRAAFESFRVSVSADVDVDVDERVILYGAEAVIRLELEVQRLKADCNDNSIIAALIEDYDPADRIYGHARMFCNMVRIISEKLSGSNGFDLEDRNSHYLTLINFTDFSLLSLIMMSAKYLDYPSVQYLKTNEEFCAVLVEVGLSASVY